jgi:hypothetical protein
MARNSCLQEFNRGFGSMMRYFVAPFIIQAAAFNRTMIMPPPDEFLYGPCDVSGRRWVFPSHHDIPLICHPSHAGQALILLTSSLPHAHTQEARLDMLLRAPDELLI